MNIHLNFSGPITLNLEGVMADLARINKAIDDLQVTVDATQDNIAAVLTLLRANPTQAELAEIERRLQAVQQDLSSTSFDAGAGTQEGDGGDTPAVEPGISDTPTDAD